MPKSSRLHILPGIKLESDFADHHSSSLPAGHQLYIQPTGFAILDAGLDFLRQVTRCAELEGVSTCFEIAMVAASRQLTVYFAVEAIVARYANARCYGFAGLRIGDYTAKTIACLSQEA